MRHNTWLDAWPPEFKHGSIAELDDIIQQRNLLRQQGYRSM